MISGQRKSKLTHLNVNLRRISICTDKSIHNICDRDLGTSRWIIYCCIYTGLRNYRYVHVVLLDRCQSFGLEFYCKCFLNSGLFNNSTTLAPTTSSRPWSWDEISIFSNSGPSFLLSKSIGSLWYKLHLIPTPLIPCLEIYDNKVSTNSVLQSYRRINLACVCPVSYTHLDVYKRQLYILRIKNVLAFSSLNSFCVII